MADEERVLIHHEYDIVTARQKGRDLAATIGFSGSQLTLIATAISEVARNIISYAQRGEIVLNIAEGGHRRGIQVVAIDNGPGIPDIERAMQDGFSTGNSLGLWLPGAKRLMDDFDVVSEVGKGTTITMKKWKR